MIVWNGKITGDNGVSESLGFLLIFTMVIIGIGLVTLYGYPMLLQQQTSADKQIMQKNMIVLQNDVKSLAFKTVPYKETMLNIGGGSLTIYPSDPSITLTPTSEIGIYEAGSGLSYVENFHPGDLRYHSTTAGGDISLQNGAVVMRNAVEPGSVMVAEPRWFYDSQTNTMVVNLISLNSSTKISRGGVGVVQMRMIKTNYSEHATGNTVCLRYDFDSSQDYSKAWENYFFNTLKTDKAGCGSDYRLPVSSGILVVKKYDVEIVSL